jgi:hypothetical protein
MHASGCTQHPGAYRRSARPSRGGEEKEEEQKEAGGEKMMIRKTSS